MGSPTFFPHVSGAFSSWHPTIPTVAADAATAPAVVKRRARRSGAIVRTVRIMESPPRGAGTRRQRRARGTDERWFTATEPKPQGLPNVTPGLAALSTRVL